MSTDQCLEMGAGQQEFSTTHWTTVVLAAEGQSVRSAEALEKLCRAYWYPLYAYVRRQGYTKEAAQDLTQEFFARLLRRDYLSHADRERGRFRTFLLTSLQRFIINERAKDHAEKRGSGHPAISRDAVDPESRYQAEPADHSTPEKIFEKRWALTLLERVVGLLRNEYVANDKAGQFDRLKLLLWGGQESPSCLEVAASLGMTEGALKVAVHRMRHRYRELLRAEVAQTVANPGEVDEELRHLIRVIGG